MKIDIIRHSLSHIMAQAVKDIFQNVKFGIGPTIENGFYYDFGLDKTLAPEDLPKIEKRMKELIKQNIKFEKSFATKTEANKLFKNQPFKLELIKDLKAKKATIYKSGEFIDLCAGPHVKSTKEINPDAFKLTKIAGAYWRGDEKNPMLQRIYGVAFDNKNELAVYLKQIEEAEKRDHRVLGQKLDLFSIDEEVGPGLILWHPKGAMLRQTIEDFWIKEHLANGYEIIRSPHVGRIKLWQPSGHTNFYKENMFGPMEVEGDKYLIKPMNCPFHIKIYKTQTRSYRDLPLRWAELGTVYRYERSGVLHGLARVRGFTQDDAHIFCRPDQLEAEVTEGVTLARFMMNTFGFSEYELLLSTRPEKYAGTIQVWEDATEALRNVLEHLELNYEIDPGEGVFYGPKIDVKLKDALGRLWQGPTIQVDFNLPQRFDVNYIGEDGLEHQVVMVHRTVLGSMERFMACLIEHYAGVFPVWLSPVQVAIIPIADRHLSYANKVAGELRECDIRVQVDGRSERMNLKIREAQLEKIPYMFIVGDKEMDASQVSLRLRSGEDLGLLSVPQFMDRVKPIIVNKAQDKL